MFYLTVVPVLTVSLYMIVYLRSLRKHDTVLYRICQVRRNTMAYLRDNSETVTREEYVAMRKLVYALNVTISEYNVYKTVFFNLRIFLRYLKEYEKFAENVEKIRVPKNSRIQEMYDAATYAFLCGFLSYTPLIKSEFAVRIIFFVLSILAKLGMSHINSSYQHICETLKSVREDARHYGVC